MFLGSFNAGCAYLTRTDKRKIRLFKNANFSWLIGDKVDTTVTDMTNCAYDRCVWKIKVRRSGGRQAFIFHSVVFMCVCDRIVVHGTAFLKAVVPFSAKVFNIGQNFKLPQSMVGLSVCLSLFAQLCILLSVSVKFILRVTVSWKEFKTVVFFFH